MRLRLVILMTSLSSCVTTPEIDEADFEVCSNKIVNTDAGKATYKMMPVSSSESYEQTIPAGTELEPGEYQYTVSKGSTKLCDLNISVQLNPFDVVTPPFRYIPAGESRNPYVGSIPRVEVEDVFFGEGRQVNYSIKVDGRPVRGTDLSDAEDIFRVPGQHIVSIEFRDWHGRSKEFRFSEIYVARENTMNLVVGSSRCHCALRRQAEPVHERENFIGDEGDMTKSVADFPGFDMELGTWTPFGESKKFNYNYSARKTVRYRIVCRRGGVEEECTSCCPNPKVTLHNEFSLGSMLAQVSSEDDRIQGRVQISSAGMIEFNEQNSIEVGYLKHKYQRNLEHSASSELAFKGDFSGSVSSSNGFGQSQTFDVEGLSSSTLPSGPYHLKTALTPNRCEFSNFYSMDLVLSMEANGWIDSAQFSIQESVLDDLIETASVECGS